MMLREVKQGASRRVLLLGDGLAVRQRSIRIVNKP